MPLRGPSVTFLALDVYGMGGTVRVVSDLANHLARSGYTVRILSLLRHQRDPAFPLDERVTVEGLLDRTQLRSRLGRGLDRFQSQLCPPGDVKVGLFSMWTDVLLLRRLAALEPGIIVATRPSLALIAARFSSKGTRVVAQEHTNLSSHSAGLRGLIQRIYPMVDALAVLTEQDRTDYAQALGEGSTRIVRIPNALPPGSGDRGADLDATVVIAVGRLVRVKGFDLLIEAFGSVVERHPDWELRIFGVGHQKEDLVSLIRHKGLDERVRLMGASREITVEMAKGSIFVMSSRFEGFGMALIEAMSCGMAVVSFDCPTGPGEIITDGVDGILVAPEDTVALSSAICRAIEDPGLRTKLGDAARASVVRFEPERIGRMWTDLFAELAR